MKITTAQIERCSNTGPQSFPAIFLLAASFPPLPENFLRLIKFQVSPLLQQTVMRVGTNKTRQLEFAIQIGLKPTAEENSLISSI